MFNWTSFLIGFISGGCASGCFVLLTLIGFAIQQQGKNKEK